MKGGEKLILRSSEIVGYDTGFLYDDHSPTTNVLGREKGYEHRHFRFDTDQTPDHLSANCVVPGKGRFQLELTTHEEAGLPLPCSGRASCKHTLRRPVFA